MIISAHQIMIIFLVLLSRSGVGRSEVKCKEAERRALLEFKDGLKENDALSSWREEEAKRDCCEWIGIRCSEKSGHVVTLNLSLLTINITDNFAHITVNYVSPSLVQLKHLNYLNLSGINFDGNSIPGFIGDLRELRYLDLSFASLTGKIPSQLGNLSNLHFLDLNYNNFLGETATMKNLEWASRLSSLRVLDLAYSNMTFAHDWVHVVSNLTNLKKLGLRSCFLPNVVLPLSFRSTNSLAFLDLSGNSISDSVLQWLFFSYSHSLVRLDLTDCSLPGNSIHNDKVLKNMASLEYLSLSLNNLGVSILESLGNITTLKYLDLSSNKLTGSIPKSFGNMTSLVFLNLEDNSLEGEIPKSIWEICTLESLQARHNNLNGRLQFTQSSSRCAHSALKLLDLSSNQVTGSVPNFTIYPSLLELRLSSNRFSGSVSQTIGRLSKLQILDISRNSLNGVISEAHFFKSRSLYYLDLSNNPGLVLNMSSQWNPNFQLEAIHLGSCQLGPHFPNWLQTQKHFIDLDISNAGISDPIPDWIWSSSTQFRFLNLSLNNISGPIIHGQHTLVGESPTIDLSSNQIQGSIPSFLFQGSASYLSHNKFSSLDSICKLNNSRSLLSLLDISFNQLAGELPDCWLNLSALQILILSNNNFSGNIPQSLGSLSRIAMLDLGANSFTGNLPPSLGNSPIAVLDVGENMLIGKIPQWIGALENLVILNLRSNRFHGNLPSNLCRLPYIQLLDLSSNKISGEIPSCIGNLTSMTKNGSLEGNDMVIYYEFNNGNEAIYLLYSGYGDGAIHSAEVTINWKGKMFQYKNTLRLLKIISLSNNKLVGDIPREVTDLDGLVALDLSRNGLTGQIPEEIGNLRSLEVLDLSSNHLSGNIPSTLSQLSFINALDVSNNILRGKIPTSTQLQSFDPESYMGNIELCGDPLPEICPREERPISDAEDQQDSFVTPGFYVALGLGFVVGFWGICGSLLLVRSWRYAYFKFIKTGKESYLRIINHFH